MTKRISSFIVAAAPIALAAASFAVAAPAFAQDDAAQQQHSFQVPAGRLAQSVLVLSEQASVQVVFDSETTGSVNGNAVSGAMGLGDALDRMLAGTGLKWRWLRSGVVTIETGAATQDDERGAGVVRVEGYQGSPYFGGAGVAAGVNGTNGSRDITATEGTGSFTSGALTIGSKAPQAMKDVPQSVSVLTSERMAQQNITDFNGAMVQLPGVTLQQGQSALEPSFYSRGFRISTFQVDGGSPMQMEVGLNTGSAGYFTQIDMSVYDHVELLRGAAGLFNGYGDPGGTVSLVRKKPLDHSQVTLEGQLGSWNNYRLVLDGTSPIGLDGALRGRIVMTYQDKDFFYDTAHESKSLIYGVVELDATPTTLLRAGIQYTDQDATPWYGGLPRSITGEALDVPRSTSFAFPWNRWDFTTTELFAALEQKIGEDWMFKINATRNKQRSYRKIAAIAGAVDPDTGFGPRFSGSNGDFGTTQWSFDGTLSGAFDLFGQRQELVVGANRTTSFNDNLRTYNSFPSLAANAFDFDPENPMFTEPASTLPNRYYPYSKRAQTGAYVSLRLTAFDRLHLTTGFRWNKYESVSDMDALCTTTVGICAGRQIGDAYFSSHTEWSGTEVSWPPPVSLSFDVTKSLSVYAGYTDIYRDQSSFLDTDYNPLRPATGSNWEAGIKWAARDGKLNVSLSAYDISQHDLAVLDVLNYQPQPNGVTCCAAADPDSKYLSKGIDFEVTGEVVRGLQLSGSYNYSKNKQTGSYFLYSGEGIPFATIQPKHLYKLWMSYDFGAAGYEGALSGLTLSGGLNGQSSAYFTGSACKPGFSVVNPQTGAVTCPPQLGPNNTLVLGTQAYNFSVDPYAVFSARIDYRLSKTWSMSVNLDNVFDKTYFQTVNNSISYGTWFGAPRSVSATIRAKW